MRLAVMLLLAGCAATPPAPRDAGIDAQMVWPDAGADGGARDAGRDAGTDAGPADAGTDGGSPDGGLDGGARDAGRDGGTDAGAPAIVVDGLIGASEWAGAIEASSATPTAWAGNELRRLLATVRAGRLFVAVEGRVEGNNAIVVYVDNALGTSSGVADLSTLTDSTGSLDDAISAGFATPSSFRPDYAWGTQDMGRSAVGFDARIGWRDIAVADPSDFGWVSASDAPASCSATACETSIPLAMLGGAPPRTIALFARITNADGLVSPNQTLPMDDPAAPRTVSMLMRVGD